MMREISVLFPMGGSSLPVGSASVTPIGWMCPKCEQIWAPFVEKCGTCKLRGEV